MPGLIEDIRREVDDQAEAVRKQLNTLVHRRRFLRNYLRILEADENSPANYAEVVLEKYRRELERSDREIAELRAILAAWRHAQKKLRR